MLSAKFFQLGSILPWLRPLHLFHFFSVFLHSNIWLFLHFFDRPSRCHLLFFETPLLCDRRPCTTCSSDFRMTSSFRDYPPPASSQRVHILFSTTRTPDSPPLPHPVTHHASHTQDSRHPRAEQFWGVGLGYDIHSRAMFPSENTPCMGEHTLSQTLVDPQPHTSSHQSTAPDLGVQRITIGHRFTFLMDGMSTKSLSKHFHPHASRTTKGGTGAIPERTDPSHIQPHHILSILRLVSSLAVFSKDVDCPVVYPHCGQTLNNDGLAVCLVQ